jgi:mRNA-degrading endonuclease RelE of RelBE toxin-antitoxin system
MAKVQIELLPHFQKEFKVLLKKYRSLPEDIELLFKNLTEDPIMGQSLGNNCYKIRLKISSKNTGKSGGARLITCVKILKNTVYLISIYDKADKENVTKVEIDSILKISGITS